MPIDHRLDAAQLPTPSALLRAFLHTHHPDPTRHQVLDAARGLANCHDRRRKLLEQARDPAASSSGVAAYGRLVDAIDNDRVALIARIDDWVAAHVEHRDGASLHTETLGAVIDRMAAKWIAAQLALAAQTTTTPRQREARTHLQWCRLAELTDGYRDLITDVTEHRRRLPVW
ncbi:DUF4254 domain-containing protein [Nocardia sp. NPDC058705]|uniref:DUF4254 domain-containing protein n=1 Tax=Nocardia sp. NPDC058705 TaxID=3346609 RepID=UPI0036C851D6